MMIRNNFKKVIYLNGNINYNIKETLITYDTDGVMLWNGKRCESEPASPEEIAEMEAMIKEIVGDSNE